MGLWNLQFHVFIKFVQSHNTLRLELIDAFGISLSLQHKKKCDPVKKSAIITLWLSFTEC
jgi:hypothetical protein